MSELKNGFINYRDCNKNHSDVNRLVIQVESLHKLQNDFRNYDLIILDESESILQQFASSTTMKERLDKNVIMFEKLMRNSNNVICSDAFISKKTIDMIEILRSHTVIHYEWNTHISQKREAFEYESFENLNAKLEKLLRNGKKVFYVLSSKNKADKLKETIQNILPSIRIGIYSSTEGDRKSLLDVRSSWVLYDLLIITSTITVGVNFDIPYFDYVFMYLSGFGPSIRDMIQYICEFDIYPQMKCIILF
jgi:hypothetical protein